MKRLPLTLAVFLLATLLQVAATNASVTHSFSEFSSDETSPTVLTADVTYTVQGSQLLIDINNTSDYRLTELYFNTDTTLAGLSFDWTSDWRWGWKINGTGTSQDYAGDGMGVFNWMIDFGSRSRYWLKEGVTHLVLNMVGTTTEETIMNKLSTNPPGSIETVGVLKFQAGLDDDSAYGGAHVPEPPEPPVVPEPSTLILLGLGLVGLVGVTYHTHSNLN